MSKPPNFERSSPSAIKLNFTLLPTISPFFFLLVLVFFFFFALMTVAQTVNHLKIMIPPGSKSHAERQMLNKQL